MLIVMAGLPGTGKTTLAKELSRRLQACYLNKDEQRQVMFSAEELQYTTEQDDTVMEKIYSQAMTLLLDGRQVIVDGRCYSRQIQLNRLFEIFQEPFVPRLIYCCCDAVTAQQRLESDLKHPAANRDFKLYQKMQKQQCEIIYPHLTIKTDDISLDGAVALIKDKLFD